MINNKNTVKPKQRRILKTNYYLKRLLKKLRKRLVRRWQEMPLIRHNAVKDNSNLKNRLHTSPKKIKHRTVSTTEEDKISRVKSFKVRSQCSDLNINQDFITLKKTPPLKNFSALIKPMKIFTLSRLICRLPILTKIFYYSEKSIQKSRTRPIVTINTVISAYTPEYKYEYTDFHNKRRSISLFNPDSTIHPYFDFVKKYPLFEKNSFNKSINPEDSERNLHLFHKPSDNNLSETCLDNIMQQIDNSTADLFKLKEDAKKLKKNLKNSENSQQKTEYFIHQLQALEEKVIQIESLRIQAMTDIINIDPNSKDSEGKTLAHHLAEYGDFILLRDLILSKKLNPFIKDNQGFLPKDTANNNRLSITAKHMENTREFLSSLTPEGWASHPEPKSSFEFNTNTRGYFMLSSNSSKETKTTSSSGNRNFSSGNQIPFKLENTNSHSNTDSLIDLIEKDENSDQDLEFLFNSYLSSNPPINFKKTCNEAILHNKPFYLFIILNHFKNYHPIRPKKDYISSPLVYATTIEGKLYPFAMLLLCNDRLKDLHITHKSDDYENVFDTANRIQESFYVFLLVKKKEKLINIIDEKHTNISKEAIKHTVNDPLLNGLYEPINLKFNQLKNYINSLLHNIYNNKESPKQNRCLNIRDIISSTEKHIIEIEKDLQELKKTYDSIYQSIKNNNTTNNIHPTNPFLSHTPQSSSQTGHPTSQNLINNHTINNIHPTNPFLSHTPQSSPQTGHPTSQNLINNHTTNNIYTNPFLSLAPQSSSQTGHPTSQNLINNHTTNNIYTNPFLSLAPQSSSQTGHPTSQNLINNHTTNNIHPTNPFLSHTPQSSSQTGHPTSQNLINNHTTNNIHPTNPFLSHTPQSSSQTGHPTSQNLINNHTINNIYTNSFLSLTPQSSSQTSHPTGRNLTNALASYHPQSSHQASQSTTDQQYLSLSSNHSPAFRSEQSISQEPQNINSIPNLINLSTSF